MRLATAGPARRAVVAAVTVLVLAGGALATVAVQASATNPPTIAFIQEPFTGAGVQVPGDWSLPTGPGTNNTNVACLTAGTAASGAAVPKCAGTADMAGAGALELTSDQGNEEGGVADSVGLPSAQGLDVSFDTYQYGASSGADGTMFFLAATNPADPQPPSALGEPGGHLAYSGGGGAPTGAGLVDGYLGVGFDVYGNYTNAAYDGSGCSSPSWAGNGAQLVPNAVTVRGPGSGNAGYCLLSSTAANGSLEGKLGAGPSGTRPTSLVPAEIAVNPTGSAMTTASGISVPPYSYVVAVTPLGGPTQQVSGSLPDDTYLPPADSSWLDPLTGIPRQLTFGFAASTGGLTDVHEITNVQAAPITANPPDFGLALSDTEAGVLVPGSSLTYSASPSVSASGGPETAAPSLATTLPAGVTPGAATGAGWSCSTSGQTVACAYTGTLPLNAGAELADVSVPASVEAGASGAEIASSTLWENGGVTASTDDPGTAQPAAQSAPALGLALTDSDAGQLVQSGAATYTATGVVSSSGGPEDEALTFSATFPADQALAGASGTDWSCTISAPTVQCSWQGGAIAAGTVLPAISVGATVASDATGAQPVTATLSSPDASPAAADANDEAVVASTPTLEISLGDDSGGGDLALGATVGYTVATSVSATGWDEADAPVVTDNFPNVFSAISVDASSTEWSCLLTTAATGDTETCAYTGIMPLVGGTTLQALQFDNTVEQSGNAGTAANDSASIVSNDAPVAATTDYGRLEEGPAPNLSIVASAPSLPTGSYVLDLQALVLSSGGPTSYGPTVTATLPRGESFTAAPAPSGWSCNINPGHTVLNCTSTASTIAKGTTLPLIAASVAPSKIGLATAQVTMADNGDGAEQVATSSTVSVPVPILVLATSGTPAIAYAGGTYVLTLSASTSSAGGPAFNNLVQTTTLPAGETFAAAPSPSGWACALSGSNTVLTCTYTVLSSGPLPPGSSLSDVVATVGLSATASGTLQTTAQLADTSDNAITVQQAPSLSASSVPSLSLSATGTPSDAAGGSSYTLTLSSATGNVGGPAGHEPTLQATLPTDETFSSTAPAPAGYNCSLSEGYTVLTCVATLPTPIVAGTTLANVVDTVTIAGGASGSYQTDATLSDTPDGSTTVAQHPSVSVTSMPGLVLSTSGTPTGASAGSSYVLDLSSALSSSGPVYNDPVLTVTLPGGETFASPAPSSSGWSCLLSSSDDVLTCTATATTPISAGYVFGDVDAAVDIAGTASGNEQTLAALTDSTDGASSAAQSPTVMVTGPPVLGLTAVGTPAAAAAGSSYTLTLTPSVSGTGGPVYHEPLLTATVPSGEAFASPVPAPSGWSCTLSSGGTVLSCTSTLSTPIGAPMALSAVASTVVIGSGAMGSLQTAITLADPSDMATTVVSGPAVNVTAAPVLVLSTSGTPAAASAGSSYALTLTPALGPWPDGPAYNEPTVTLTLPAGETVTAPTPPGWSCSVSSGNTVLSCTLTGPTPVGAGSSLGPVSVTVTIAPGASGPLQATAVLVDPGDGAPDASQSATVTAAAAPVLVLTTSGTPSSGSPGSPYTLTLAPSLGGSPGGPAYNDPLLSVTLPAGETFSAPAPSPAGWSCTLSPDVTVLTCTSTAPVPVVAGTSLGDVAPLVVLGPTGPGTLTTTATLSDTGDAATPVTQTPAVTISGPQAPVLPILQLWASAPSTVPAGGSFSLRLGLSLSPRGGRADNDPTVSVDLPDGETFAGPGPRAPGWACARSTGSTVLACSWTAGTPIEDGTDLGQVDATIDVAPQASGTITTGATLTDSPDRAASVQASATVSVPGEPGPAPVLGPQGYGYRLLGADGGVFDFGTADFKGSCKTPGQRCHNLADRAVGIASTANGEGYWVVGADGGVFAFGDARYVGSCPSGHRPCGAVSAHIVGIAATPDGQGYWLAGANGAVYGFGDADKFGRCPKAGGECGALPAPIVSIAATPQGQGYWLVGASGSVYPFGDAAKFGACTTAGSRCQRVSGPIVGMASTSDGQGYWLAGADGGVFAFGDATFMGSIYTADLGQRMRGPIVGITTMPDGQGYWLAGADGGVFSFEKARFLGNTYTAKVAGRLGGHIVGIDFAW